jgi:hypothetical protein
MRMRRLAWALLAVVLGVVLGAAFVVTAILREPAPARWRKEDLQDADPAVRATALRTAPGVGIERLIQALEDEDVDVRLLAAQRLHDPEALVGALGDRHLGVSREAARSLGDIGWAAWRYLVEAMEDPRPRVRAGAVLALVFSAGDKFPSSWPSREQMEPPLRKLLDDPDAEVRRNAKAALESIDWLSRRGR